MDILKKVFMLFVIMGLFIPLSFAEDENISYDEDNAVELVLTETMNNDTSINMDINVSNNNASIDMIEEIEFDEEMVKSNRAICNSLPIIKKQLQKFNELVQKSEDTELELEKTLSKQEFIKYKKEKDGFLKQRNIIKQKYEQLNKACINIDRIDGSSEVNQSIQQTRTQIKFNNKFNKSNCDEFVQLEAKVQEFNKKVSSMKKQINNSQEIDMFREENKELIQQYNILRTRCRIKLSVDKFQENKKIIYESLKNTKQTNVQIKTELVKKHNNGALEIEEVKEYINNNLYNQLDKLNLYKEKIENSNFEKKDTLIAGIIKIEDKINSYISQIESVNNTEELINLSKEIKTELNRKSNIYSLFNVVAMSNNYNKITYKITEILEKVKEQYPEENFTSIAIIEEKIINIKTKIANLEEYIENADYENLSDDLKEFKANNQEINKELKAVYAEFKNLKKEISQKSKLLDENNEIENGEVENE